MHRYMRIWLAATVAAVSVLSEAIAAGADSATNRVAGIATVGAPPDWGPCPDFPPPTGGSPLADVIQCATISVPLDYRNPSGQKIDVAVSRLQTAVPSMRRGVLLFNPGGPGGPGLDLPILFLLLGIPASIVNQYDLIGFDPRGVGQSTPVSCGFTPEQANVRGPTYPQGPADVAAHAEAARALADQCQAVNPAGYLQHFTTANTARDLDQIRIALGEEKLSYLGYSYGTYLGAVYAQLFPERTDRFVLDSALAPNWVWRTQLRAWGRAAEIRFPDFAKWAAARDGTYELGRTAKQVRQKYFEIAAKLDQTPYPFYDGTFFRLDTFFALYSNTNFPALAQLWQGIDRDDTVTVARLARTLTGPSGSFGPVPADNFAALQLNVICNDASWPRSVQQYQSDVETDRRRYPLVGAMMANLWPCAVWPTDPVEPPVSITGDGPSNILILQNLRDPATIYDGAVELRRALGQRARLVSVDAGGHGVYLTVDNACASNSATQFLVHGRLPTRDTLCRAEQSLNAKTSETRSGAAAELLRRQR